MTDRPVYLENVPAYIRTLPVYNAGLSAESVGARYGVARIAKLGSNENPYGPSPRVLEALGEAIRDIALYPDSSSDVLRAGLSHLLNVPPGLFIIGNGSEDLISVVSRAFLSPGAEFVTMIPSFGLHLICGQSTGAIGRTVTVNPDFHLDVDQVIAAVNPRTRLVILSNPSNPVGTSMSVAELRRLLDALEEKVLLVFDEAYFEYAEASGSYPDFQQVLAGSKSPWLLMRTFSKAYGLAGLRVGYGVASSADLMDVLERVRAPFNVNRLAQIAAAAALEDPGHMRDCIHRTILERERVRAALEALGYHPAPSLTNFLFFDAGEDAAGLATRLLTRGVIVKPWREPGFLNFVRVSVGAPEANDQFLAALKSAARSVSA